MHLTFYTIRSLIVFLKVLTMLNIFVSTGSYWSECLWDSGE